MNGRAFGQLGQASQSRVYHHPAVFPCLVVQAGLRACELVHGPNLPPSYGRWATVAVWQKTHLPLRGQHRHCLNEKRTCFPVSPVIQNRNLGT